MTRIVFATLGSLWRPPGRKGLQEGFHWSELFAWCDRLGLSAALATYASPREIDGLQAYADLHPGLDLWIDSGAFTAWTTGKVIRVEDYAAELERRLPGLRGFGRVFPISLDRIPGRFGTPPSPDDVARATEESIRNALWLQQRGFNVIPIHHQGEPLWVMEEYLRAGFDYLGISPANDASIKSRVRYVRSLWPLFKRPGPLVATHSFGNTNEKVLREFPFYSADSQVWRVTIHNYGNSPRPSLLGSRTIRNKQTSFLGSKMTLTQYKASIQRFLDYERQIKALWRHRGVSWQEPRGTRFGPA